MVISFNKKITSNKQKNIRSSKKTKCLTTKDYNFFLGRMLFTSNDESQDTFFYQPTLELKKDKGTDYILSSKSKGLYIPKPKPLYVAFST